MVPVVVQPGALCCSGVEDAAAEDSGVALASDVTDAKMLSVAVGPVPVGRLLNRLVVSTVATIANTATRPITTHVAARR
jgi:hypothetical protein